MGRVYLAEHVRMGRMSAIKVMSPGVAPTPEAVGRFNREAANASRINHPNVASVYDFGETADGTLYLAMEYVNGTTLAESLRVNGPLAFERVGDFTRQIADALHAAHQLGIVHRDLKPDNILVTRDVDGIERIKVVDFGIAKAASGGGQTVTDAGVSVGTPAYMSPEQLAGDPIDLRSDIYSLGLIVFAMLTGTLPHADVSGRELLVQRLTERPAALSSVVRGTTWPPTLQVALDRAMSPAADDRYRRAIDFALDVATALGLPAGAVEHRTRPLTPLGVPGITQPLRASRLEGKPSDPVAEARRLRLAAGVAAVLLVAALGLWRYRTSPSDPAVAVTASNPAASRPDSLERPAAASALTRDTATSVRSPASVGPARTPSPKTPLASAQPVVARSERDTSITPTRDLTRVPRGGVRGGRDSSFRRAAAALRGMPGGVPDSASLSALANVGTRVGRRGGLHPWLRANGDSAAPPARGNVAADAEANEILGHIGRAQKMLADNKPMPGVVELRTAYEEYLFLAADHPNAPQTARIGERFKTMLDSAVTACTTGEQQAASAMSCMIVQQAASMMPLAGGVA